MLWCYLLSCHHRHLAADKLLAPRSWSLFVATSNILLFVLVNEDGQFLVWRRFGDWGVQEKYIPPLKSTQYEHDSSAIQKCRTTLHHFNLALQHPKSTVANVRHPQKSGCICFTRPENYQFYSMLPILRRKTEEKNIQSIWTWLKCHSKVQNNIALFQSYFPALQTALQFSSCKCQTPPKIRVHFFYQTQE